MVRMQIQLTEEQADALRQLSASQGLSIAELVRQGVDLQLSRSSPASRQDVIERAIHISGKFASGLKDVSVNHDRYLAEALKR